MVLTKQYKESIFQPNNTILKAQGYADLLQLTDQSGA